MSPTVEIPDELILAALGRAIRHRGGERYPPAGPIYAHLDIPSRSGSARHVYRRLLALAAAGVLERSRRLDFTVWSLTSTGKRRLSRALRAGIVELPESPQHRAWRDARTLAAREIDRIRDELIDTLTDAMELAERESPSDRLFEIAARSHSGCRRLASAIYCLNEWAEPDDAHPDIDERLTPEEMSLDRVERARLRARRAGRRNIHFWSEHRATGENN